MDTLWEAPEDVGMVPYAQPKINPKISHKPAGPCGGEITNVEVMTLKTQLYWTGHV